jgi:hypothetical protein
MRDPWLMPFLYHAILRESGQRIGIRDLHRGFASEIRSKNLDHKVDKGPHFYGLCYRTPFFSPPAHPN